MPSRASIFTGQYAHNHQLWANGVLLRQELPTMGSFLKEAGYATASIGKAHLSPYGAFGDAPQDSMEDHRRWNDPQMQKWHGPYWGFDYVEFVLNHATRPTGHYGSWFFAHGGTVEMITESDFGKNRIGNTTECHTTDIPERLHDSTFIGCRSAEFIREKADEGNPFFLTASFPDPHHPFNPPAETAARYVDAGVTLPIAEDDNLEDRPRHYQLHQQCVWHPAGAQQVTDDMSEEERAAVPFYRELVEKRRNPKSEMMEVGKSSQKVTNDERDARIRSTYAMIDLIDKGVGNILSALEETGQLDNTVIIFAADHGELMGDHGLWKKGPFFYDGLMNTPLIIFDPDHNPGVCYGMASLVDVFPTAAALLNLPAPIFCDGMALTAAMEDGVSRTECLIEYRNGFLEHELHANAIVDDHYKFVQYNTDECELTDRINDKEERVNLAANEAHAQLVNEYRKKLLMLLLNTPTRYPINISSF